MWQLASFTFCSRDSIVTQDQGHTCREGPGMGCEEALTS